MTTANFAPELLELVKVASEKPVNVKLDTKAQVTNLRHRFHKMRKDMRAENHPLLLAAEQVETKLVETQESFILRFQPVDNTFKQALAEAGISVPEWNEVEVEDESPSQNESSTADAVAQFLKGGN